MVNDLHSRPATGVIAMAGVVISVAAIAVALTRMIAAPLNGSCQAIIAVGIGCDILMVIMAQRSAQRLAERSTEPKSIGATSVSPSVTVTSTPCPPAVMQPALRDDFPQRVGAGRERQIEVAIGVGDGGNFTGVESMVAIRIRVHGSSGQAEFADVFHRIVVDVVEHGAGEIDRRNARIARPCST